MVYFRLLRQWLVTGLVIANVLVVILSAYSLNQSHAQFSLRAQATSQNVARALDQQVSSSIDKIDYALRVVVDELERQLGQNKRIDEKSANAFLANHQARLPEIEALRVANAQGWVVLGKNVNLQEPVSWADRGYFAYHRDRIDGELKISKPVMGKVAKRFIVGLSRRYNYPDGSFAGVVSAPIALDYFTNMLSHFSLGEHSTLILRSSEDLGLITRFPPILDKPAGQVGNNGVSAEFRKLADSGIDSATYYSANSSDGYERTLTFHRLHNAPIIALVGLAADDYLAEWKNEVTRTAGVIVGFVSLSVFLGAFLLRLIAQAYLREKDIQRSEVKFRTLYDATTDAVWLLDENGFIDCNPAAVKIFGCADKAALEGRLPSDLSPEYQDCGTRSLTRAKELIKQAFAKGNLRFEWLHQRMDNGHVFPCEVLLTAMQMDGHHLLQAVVRDISERRHNETVLIEAKQAAEAATHAKSQFLATMSHEIRTPMNGVLGMAQLLMMPGISENERLEFAKTILNSGQTLLALLNSILDLSKVESGKLVLESVPVNPQQLIEESAALFSELAASKGLSLETVWQGAENQFYWSDSNRLRQMVSNLIGNAIKFTETGFVRIEAREIMQDEGTAVIEFSIIDSGVGIPADKQGLLFKPFTQADSSITRNYGGTGLGLSIVHSLAGLMGGEAGVDSELGKGSRFWFRITAEVMDE